MPFHFCFDELRAIAFGIAFGGTGIMLIRHYWHKIWHRSEAQKDDGCCDGHDHE